VNYFSIEYWVLSIEMRAAISRNGAKQRGGSEDFLRAYWFITHGQHICWPFFYWELGIEYSVLRYVGCVLRGILVRDIWFLEFNFWNLFFGGI